MASTSPPAGSARPPPPPLPKESFLRRNKFVLPIILAVNLSAGAYLFMRTKKNDVGAEAGEVSDSSTSAVTAVAEKQATVPAPVQPAVVHEPIPEKQQRELMKWILEEKRKLKPKDPEEKRRIDEEKALLKQFIRAKSIPSL
ncbi:uncharacterized protein LOC132603713 isoform X2 [Lycium barbarum]|uniref:uncharacterized protein LOC132603713 isoform X2 n=1 Tax=Lycium barbarum TaxID=112863 RepID=UPI00293E89A7|nr:uncharacterized protein LOC132603713 isoform X2 [Lycium barbarum]